MSEYLLNLHEIEGSRRYEYRYVDSARFFKFSRWIDVGPASPTTLTEIITPLKDAEYEVREVCQMADEAGRLIGQLIFSERVACSFAADFR